MNREQGVAGFLAVAALRLTYPERPHRLPARVVRKDVCDAERGCVASIDTIIGFP